MKWLLVVAMMSLGLVVSQKAEAGPAIRIIASVETVKVADVVRKLRSDKDGVKVMFSKHQGSYYLPKSNPHYADLLKKLESSLKSQKAVDVTAEQGQLNIVDVK
ncbi:hypothetical protein EZJ49_14035 [Bdellovibrio bacteriovorus]|uniref:hypothetical protein n=1 Tax=Bdellovibrio bacteriovorus TaxID=959 RepID=UPI0021CFC070|nr:hypothetical protein [Bdellovibrio bacteriovorus]UXR64182.1 hypothetical protein EZJ49_14035 [Bdellovibrio bacteriovorus]BFD68568.1 hypothetical protein HAGR004_35900 [Bdellovibrio sp. HAGR004]